MARAYENALRQGTQCTLIDANQRKRNAIMKREEFIYKVSGKIRHLSILTRSFTSIRIFTKNYL